MKIFLSLITILTLITSCVKDVTLDLPPYNSKLVVEGQIQPGIPPFVILSNSLNLFAETSTSSLENNFITDAQVFVNNGIDTIQLDLFCTDSLPPQLIPIVAELLGYSPQELQSLHICAYSTMDPNWFGVVGMTYNLDIYHGSNLYQSTTSIQNPIPLDTIFWSERASLPGYGYMSATLSDPSAPGNAYRWQSKRLNTYSDGKPKDNSFLAPFNSSFDDQFFNGIQFTFFYDNPGSYKDSTISDAHEGYYAIGDTVVISWSTIDHEVFEFLRYQDAQVSNGGSPFSSPVNIPSNVSNALGLWAGYSPVFDTVICGN